MENKRAIPIATVISSWNRKEIIYSCPRCGQSFRQFGNKELFCHHCGLAIDWNVPMMLNKPMESDNMEEEKRILDKINEVNSIGGKEWIKFS